MHNPSTFAQSYCNYTINYFAYATRLCNFLHNRIAIAQSSDPRRIYTISYVELAQSSRTCKIIYCAIATRLCHLRSIVQKIAQSGPTYTIVLHLHNKWFCKWDPIVFFYFRSLIHDSLLLSTDCVFISFHSWLSKTIRHCWSIAPRIYCVWTLKYVPIYDTIFLQLWFLIVSTEVHTLKYYFTLRSN